MLIHGKIWWIELTGSGGLDVHAVDGNKIC